jgi:cytochrome c551/c552
MSIRKIYGMAVLAVIAGVTSVSAADPDVSKLPPAAAKQGVTFATDIKPIFEKSCFKCHGPDVEKPKGKFKADSVANILKGGENAPNVVAGDIKKSTLLHAVAGITDPDDVMPPKDNKAKIAPLTKDEVALVRAWIEQGAK